MTTAAKKGTGKREKRSELLVCNVLACRKYRVLKGQKRVFVSICGIDASDCLLVWVTQMRAPSRGLTGTSEISD